MAVALLVEAASAVAPARQARVEAGVVMVGGLAGKVAAEAAWAAALTGAGLVVLAVAVGLEVS